MSADSNDLNKYLYDTGRSINGEWLKMTFPIGSFDIFTEALDPDPTLYLDIEFTEEGNAWFTIRQTEHPLKFRGSNDHTVCGFEMSPELLNRISRVARS